MASKVLKAEVKDNAGTFVTYKHTGVDAFGEDLIKFTFVGTCESYTMSVAKFNAAFNLI